MLVACGGSPTVSSSSGVSANQINVTDLSDPVGGLSAYQLINQYKPHWLQKRGTKSIENPVPIKVYLNSPTSAYGPVSSLRQIPAKEIATVRYFSGPEAQSRFGLDNVSGALLVHTKDGTE